MIGIKLEPDESFFIFFPMDIPTNLAKKPRKNLHETACATFCFQFTKNPCKSKSNLIETAFLDWKGNQPQIDEVLVIGFKIGKI